MIGLPLTTEPGGPTSCAGCGRCCERQGTPPGIWLPAMADDGTFAPVAQAEQLPAALLDELRAQLAKWPLAAQWPDAPPGPCIWFDVETKLCRHYEHRPQICREFELGSPECLDWRAGRE